MEKRLIHDWPDIDVCVYDASETEALLHVDWTKFSTDGPVFLRLPIRPYDADALIWLGYAAGRPIAVDLHSGSITVGDVSFRPAPAALAPLEPFVR